MLDISEILFLYFNAVPFTVYESQKKTITQKHFLLSYHQYTGYKLIKTCKMENHQLQPVKISRITLKEKMESL